MAYSSIVKPGDYFNTKLYTGNGTTDTAQTGVGFQPDWTWIKGRNVAYDNNVFDAVRGSTKRIITNSTNAETTANEMIKSFNSDGFTLGNDDGVNQNTKTYVAWNWKAGTTSGQATNSYSTITPTSISFNQTSGFSIIKYTGNATAGAGVPHGLGVAPKMVITKNLDSSSYGWYCYHASLGATKSLYLHNSDAVVTSNDRWNGWVPDATNVSLGTNTGTNGANNMIMYCFAEKTGYSKFGSYTGNGNADGTFVYTGFKPAFVMIKETTDSGTDWRMMDNKRSTFNLVNDRLFPNLSIAENTGDGYDFLSNGFKIRSSGGDFNGSGNNYIYMCFAEEPLVANSGTDGVPATAR